MEQNSFPFGLILGATMPVLGYFLVSGVFDILVEMDIMGVAAMDIGSQRMRTILLLSLCTSILPFNYLKRKHWDRSMQGMVFPTLIYAGMWLYTYGKTLLS